MRHSLPLSGAAFGIAYHILGMLRAENEMAACPSWALDDAITAGSIALGL